MIRFRVLQLLFLVSSMMSQVIGMVPPEEEKQGTAEGIAQSIEELPKELRNKIISFALELELNPKYELYKKLDVGSTVTTIALNADNTRALTGSKDGIARLWDVEKGTVLIELKGHTKAITSVALSADGSIAFTGSDDETARVWNTGTGELLKTLEVGSVVRSVALNADGTTALIGSAFIVLLYKRSEPEALKVLQGHTSGLLSVALSADGSSAFTGSRDGIARVFNTLTGELIKTLQIGSPVYLVALSADGSTAVIGSAGKALVWDVKTGVLLNTLFTDGLIIYSVALSKDGKRALTTSNFSTIQVWNTKPLSGKKETTTPLLVLDGHKGSIMVVAFGGAGLIASGSADRTALIWKPYIDLENLWPLEKKEVAYKIFKEKFYRPKSALLQQSSSFEGFLKLIIKLTLMLDYLH